MLSEVCGHFQVCCAVCLSWQRRPPVAVPGATRGRPNKARCCLGTNTNSRSERKQSTTARSNTARAIPTHSVTTVLTQPTQKEPLPYTSKPRKPDKQITPGYLESSTCTRHMHMHAPADIRNPATRYHHYFHLHVDYHVHSFTVTLS